MDDKLVIALLLLYFFKPFLGTITFAVVFAVMLHPIYRRKPHPVFAGVLTVALAFVLFFSIYQTVFYLYDQVAYLINIFNQFSPELQLKILNFSSQTPLYTFVLNIIQSLPGMAVKLLLLFILVYFLLVDGDKLVGLAGSMLPKKKAKLLVRAGSHNLRSIVMGVFVNTAIYTLLGTLVLYFTDTPFALLYAILAGIFGPVPVVAGWMVYGYLAVQKLIAGQLANALIILAFTLVWPLTGDLYFRIRYRGTIHPAILLLSMFAGIWMFGFAGFVIGPVLVSLAYTWVAVEQA